MDNKLFIHLGMNRTGTTFLQTQVFPLLDKVNYVPLYLENRYTRNPFLINVKPDEKTLISNENFSVFLKYTFIDQDHVYYAPSRVILQRLKQVFPDASIIFCVREQESWLRSVYNNLVKNGYPYDYIFFRKYVRFFDQKVFVDLLKKLFSNVLIYGFDEFKKNPQEIVEKICVFIGTNVPSNIDYNVVNNSNSMKDINRLLHFNKMFFSKTNPYGIHIPVSLYYLLRKMYCKLWGIKI